jgi:hypothetical protein
MSASPSRRSFLLGAAGLAAAPLVPTLPAYPPPASHPGDPEDDALDLLTLASLLAAQRVADRALARHGHRPGGCELCDDCRLVAFHCNLFFAIIESRTRVPTVWDARRLIATPLRGPRPDRAWPGGDEFCEPPRMSSETCRAYRLVVTSLAAACHALRLSDARCEDCGGCQHCKDSFPMWLTAHTLYHGVICSADPPSLRLAAQAFGLPPASEPLDARPSIDQLQAIAVRVGREALA